MFLTQNSIYIKCVIAEFWKWYAELFYCTCKKNLSVRFYFFIYLKVSLQRGERKTYWERKSSIHCFIPQMTSATKAGPSQSQELLLNLQSGCRGPSSWVICCCLPRLINRELAHKCSSQDAGRGLICHLTCPCLSF